MKIDSCIIVKNEVDNIGKLINQFLLFSNEVHITDTGSNDGTIEVIENIVKEHPNVYLHHFDWVKDFSKARNYSLTCYECKADYQFWCDADDELNDKLIETILDITKMDSSDVDIYFMKYLYAPPSSYTHFRTSLLKVSANLKWYDPIHEFIQYTTSNKIDYDKFSNGSLIIHHKRNGDEHSHRNLDIFLNMEKTKYKFSARNRFYYGRELYYQHLYEMAAYQFYKCIDSNDVNKIDKINACIKLFEIKDENAIDYFFKLFKIGVFRKDMFYWAARYYFEKKDQDTAKIYYQMCINCETPPQGLSFSYNNDCHINSLLQLGVISYNKKNIKMAIHYNKLILQIDSNHKVAKGNIELLNKQLKK